MPVIIAGSGFTVTTCVAGGHAGVVYDMVTTEGFNPLTIPLLKDPITDAFNGALLDHKPPPTNSVSMIVLLRQTWLGPVMGKGG